MGRAGRRGLLGHSAGFFNFYLGSFLYLYSLEPCHNERLRDWLNLFAIMRFHYVEVLFHMFYYYWGKEYHWFIWRTSLYRGLLHQGSTVSISILNGDKINGE